jgi:hypothetical protein
MYSDSWGGFYEGSAYGDKTFYGFKMDPLTGSVSVEIIGRDDSETIKLPESVLISKPNEEPVYIVSRDDYKVHFWSIDTITFEMNQDTGHLEMSFLS